MNEHCEYCNFRFEVEPGFFIGAMYVSYGFTVAVILTIGFPISFLINPPLWAMISIMLAIMVITLPLNFRYARVLMLYLFGGVTYNAKKAEDKIV